MPRRAHYVPLPWVHVDRSLGVPAERQICGALRQAIREGLLPRGFRLPSLRQLADDLHVSRRVVANAYEQLESEGYVAANRGGGTHVAAEAVSPRRASASIASSRRAHTMPPHNAASSAALRDAIAIQVCPSHGILATAEEIVLAPSREEAISCAARLLADPGDAVRVDGNPRTAALYQHLGLRIADPPRIIHYGAPLTPAQQSLALQEAKSLGAAIVEEAHVDHPLKALDTEGRVVYIGALAAGMTFLIVPHHLRALASNLVMPPPPSIQAALADCITTGAAHVTLFGTRRASPRTW